MIWHDIYDTIRYMICYEMIWYDMIWYMIRYDMISYEMIWNDKIWYDTWYDMIWKAMIWYDMIRYDTRYMIWYMIYDMIRYDIWYDMKCLTAIVFTPGGSSTVQIYTQTIHIQHNRHKQYIEQHNSLIRKNVDRATSLRGIPWHLPYSWGKSTEKPQSG